MKVLVQIALIADPDDAGKNDILRTTQLREDHASLPQQRMSRIIVLPPGCWLDTIRLIYLPSNVRDDMSKTQTKEFESGNYFIFYWRGRFLQVHRDHCFMPLTIGWGQNTY